MKKRIRILDRTKRGRKIIVFVSSLITVFLVALLGSLFTSSETKGSWYESIKPSITPPNWVFPIVWTILFFIIAVSLYLSWIGADRFQKRKIIWIFGANFLLNILWSAFYFGMHNPLFAFVDIIVLGISIILMISLSWKINKKAAWLLLPYFVWVAFAAFLNYLSI